MIRIIFALRFFFIFAVLILFGSKAIWNSFLSRSKDIPAIERPIEISENSPSSQIILNYRTPSDPPLLAQLSDDFSIEKVKTVSYGKIKVLMLQENYQSGINDLVNYRIQVFVSGNIVARKIVMEQPENIAPIVEIIELDQDNNHPEVIVAFYSGGNHCCTTRFIFTSVKKSENWALVESVQDGIYSSPKMHGGSTVLSYKDWDDRFNYVFDSYAGSVSPPIFYELHNTKLIDVSRNAEYKVEIKRSIDEVLKVSGDRSNGFWAGYVASKALVGEFEEAWKEMLIGYDRNSRHGLNKCLQFRDSNCLKSLFFDDFPQALKAFLDETGYI
jgi:hypothetical protein